ncbi:TolC family protein [Paludisphaera sp.]|uniref:TolC family protein n=1 Tax=Paludisphaera sp. TaxID=2017432 RepID=UPI00301CDD71
MRFTSQRALSGVVVSAGLLLTGAQARGQGAAALADDIVAISAGRRAQERARDSTFLGPVHGIAERPFPRIAGADEPRLGGRSISPRPIDVLSAASRPDLAGGIGDRRQGILPPAIPETSSATIPLYGPLELPAVDDEGPESGLTLEQSIAGVISSNPELAVKFQELPKAEADILTASLWGNPLVFASADSAPYGKYSPQRPGSNSYGVTVVQPFDVNGKIRARTRLAVTARSVLEAQYQDAVRLELEKLHVAWTDALAARTSVQYLKTSLLGYETLLRTIEERVSKEVAPETDLDTAIIQQETATVAYEEAVTRYRQAKRAVALLLGIPSAQADQIELRGTIRDVAPPAPPPEELVHVALTHRPDVVATRLGVRSATANVDVQRRERFPDVFALYTPYGFDANNDTPGAKGATSWGAGVFATVPLFNRNQGNIRRAERNVHQTQLELSGLERQVVAEVEGASLEYESSRSAVARFERVVLPRSKRLREEKFRLYTSGQEGLLTYFEAQREYNEAIRQYRDILIRHRKSMLALNTAVGRRVLP